LGIDVSAASLTVSIQRGKRRYPIATFDNDPAGHHKLVRWATKGGRRARIGVEATGIYSLDLSLALHRHPQLEVMVINPRASRSFAQAMMKRAKTDPVDAEVILAFIQRMPFVCWQPPSDEILQLQAITRRIHQLKVELNREENRLHADQYRRSLGPIIAQDLAVHIEHIQHRITHLEEQGRHLIAQVPDLESKFQRLLSVTGIGETSALRILAEVLVLPDDLQPNQWVAQAGLDPRPRESGTSVHRPRFISKAGNKYLRAALYFPAMVACRYQENVEAFYQKLIAAGKKPRQAIVAVMRKLLRCLWAMLKYDRDFEGDKFYVLA
ncbi:MAG TPA: IS110 family transposase, partial [Armatimonadetes bacterium]|nr:IS110 family transposase [Armatimonadota bacterium]